MPFTPFHLGPTLLCMHASVIPDEEPFCILLFNLPGSLHDFSHSYVGSSILTVPVAVVVYSLRTILTKIMLELRSSQKSSLQKILFTSLIGAYSHVFLHSLLYREMNPFYPLQCNPFVGVASAHAAYTVVHGFFGLSFILGIIVYLCKISRGTAVLD